MPSRLPPLNALRAFEAAGRRASMSAAAEELAVTPAAISHQIKTLEKSILLKAKERFTTTREMAKHLGISQPSVVRKLKEHKLS